MWSACLRRALLPQHDAAGGQPLFETYVKSLEAAAKRAGRSQPLFGQDRVTSLLAACSGLRGLRGLRGAQSVSSRRLILRQQAGALRGLRQRELG